MLIPEKALKNRFEIHSFGLKTSEFYSKSKQIEDLSAAFKNSFVNKLGKIIRNYIKITTFYLKSIILKVFCLTLIRSQH